MSIDDKEVLDETITVRIDDGGDAEDAPSKDQKPPVKEEKPTIEEPKVIEGSDEDEEDRPGLSEEDQEKKREERRKERHLRKQRQNEARRQKDEELESLRQALAEANTRIQRLEGNTETDLAAKTERALRNVDRQIENALAEIEAATEAGDGKRVRAATDLLTEAKIDKRKIEDYQEQLKSQRERKPAQPAAPQVPEGVVRNTQTFIGRNKWFDPGGGDEDSRIVKALDAGVAADGYDPRTKEYWEELEDRMRERLPHRFKNSTSTNKKDPPPQITGGGSKNGGGGNVTEITISRQRYEAMKESGVWDDPVRRKKVLAQYAEQDRQAAKGGR